FLFPARDRQVIDWFERLHVRSQDPLVHPQPVVFSHHPAAVTSLDASPARVRSARFYLADDCRAGRAAALLSSEQPTGERELGLWVRPKSAEDSARAAICDSFNAAITAYCLSANAPSFHHNLSRAGAVTGNTHVG